MKNLLLIAALVLAGAAAQAETMSCFVGVYKAKNLISEDQKETEAAAAIVDVKLEDGYGQTDATVNGEQVNVSVSGRDFTKDVYDLTVLLLTPEAERIPRASFVSAVSDVLITAGPAKSTSYGPRIQDGTILFSPDRYKGGAMALTKKTVDALKAAGTWGKHPFNSTVLTTQYSYYVAEALRELVGKGAMKADDVVAVGTAFDCTLNK
jgi:hypothetical protein